ncbi:hypothetical protein BFW01_g593 [Lasiodiplodia theobromae]|nr:hypothetical protein BFW01_g593 [Lasiodiplodia theobromae]
MPAQNNKTSDSAPSDSGSAPQPAKTWANVARDANKPSTGSSQRPALTTSVTTQTPAWPALGRGRVTTAGQRARQSVARVSEALGNVNISDSSTQANQWSSTPAQPHSSSNWQPIPADTLTEDLDPSRKKQAKAVTSTPPALPEAHYTSFSHVDRIIWAMLNDALLVSVDMEFFMGRSPYDKQGNLRDRKPTTPPEVGISVSDPLNLPSAERLDLVQRILTSRARHVRVKELCRFTNPQMPYYSDVCPTGCENCFQFGKTEFASLEETKQILRETILVPRESAEEQAEAEGKEKKQEAGRFRPVAVVVHDATNDIKALREELGLDLDKPEFDHVFIVDTQKVAQRQGDKRKIGLKALLAGSFISSDHAHNSGNDAFRTLAAGLIQGVQKVKEHEVATSSSGRGSPSTTGSGPTDSGADTENGEGSAEGVDQESQEPHMGPDDAVEAVRQRCRGVHQFASAQTKGIPIFCSKCHSTAHLAEECQATIRCKRCWSPNHLAETCMRIHVRSCRRTGNCPRGCWTH